MNKNRRAVILCVLFCTGLAASPLLAGCKGKIEPGTAQVKRQAVTGVEVSEALPSQIDEYYETSGTVRPKTSSVIASRVMGTVTSLRVREGERVRAGQLLMTLDDRDVAQKVKAAEKAAEAADQNRSLMDVTYGRYQKLFEGKAVSKQEMDQIETQKKVAESESERAKAGLEEARVNYGFTRITSPGSGIVTEKKIDAGSMAVPGAPLLTIEDASSFRIDVNVDEGMTGKIKTGMPVDIVIDSLSQSIRGKVSEIVPSIDPMSRTFLVKIEARGSGLRSGLYARVMIPSGKREALLLPKKAVVEKGQLAGLYVVGADGIVTYRLVRLGKEHDDNVEILSGIDPKDRVITGGIEKVVDGGILKQ
jgi:RND family efflux transporter MFP subunit